MDTKDGCVLFVLFLVSCNQDIARAETLLSSHFLDNIVDSLPRYFNLAKGTDAWIRQMFLKAFRFVFERLENKNRFGMRFCIGVLKNEDVKFRQSLVQYLVSSIHISNEYADIAICLLEKSLIDHLSDKTILHAITRATQLNSELLKRAAALIKISMSEIDTLLTSFSLQSNFVGVLLSPKLSKSDPECVPRSISGSVKQNNSSC